MISQFFIERPIFANVIAVITIIIGFVSLYRLPVAQYPNIVPPTVQVTARYPGANAETVAATMGIPIEQAVNGVEGSIYMSSTSASDGSYALTITFDVGTDLNTAMSLVQNQVNGALSQLPGGAQQQGVTVRKVSPNILLVVSLYSPDNRFNETFLSNYGVINLQNPLARIPGIGQVRVFGAGPYSMRVWLDPRRLQSFGLTTADVTTAIQGQNIQVGTGQLGSPPVPGNQPLQLTIKTLGRLTDVAQFENIIIKSATGTAPQIVRLRDIARVDLEQQTYSNFSNYKGKKSAQIVIFALPDANAIDVADRVYKAMSEMSKKFPAGLTYDIRYDTTQFVREAISGVYETLFLAGFLVLLVIFLFLQNFRAMLVPATTVPVTIIGAFIMIAAFGFTVNLITLFALVLVIGIVVDDAIVIVENSSYYIERGLQSKDAAIKAMQELTGPIMGITLALVSAFLPAAFLPGITGQIFKQFALVIASTSVISGINALTLKPVQCALWLKQESRRDTNRFLRIFNNGFQRVTDFYLAIVTWMVMRPIAMLIVFMIIINISLFVFIKRPTGFLPTEDQGFGILLARLPEGASQPRMRELDTKFDSILGKTAGVAGWVTIGGYSLLDGANVSNVSTTFVVYDDWSKRGSRLNQDKIIEGINRDLLGIPEAQAFVVIPPPIRGLGQTGGFQMVVEDRGNLGLSELERMTTGLVQAGNSRPDLLKGITTTFDNKNPQLYIDIDQTKAEAFQVRMISIYESLQAYLGSSFVNLFNKYNQVFQVYIQADENFRLNPEDIKRLYVRNMNNEMVPLSTLIDIRHVQGAELLTRYNFYPAASIFGSAAPGVSSGEALKAMEQLAAKNLREGFDYEWTSTSYQEKRVGNQAYFIYALSIILVYLVLAALYESWTSPAAVMMVVPIALVGVLIGIMSRGYDNNLYTQVGLVLMIALASKNAILIVEFARDLHSQGHSITDAAIEATRRRFRPIVMTSIAFIAGVSPLLFTSGAGSAGQRSIGTVVFGGMLASTLLAIPFVPVFYVLTERLNDRWKYRKRRQKPSSEI
jgi:HAE1 family hydrophobic/amphiphilic exporter-1